MISRKFFAFICSTAAGLLGAGAVAQASDLQSGDSARANAQCAAFGPGFAAVDGADACVWVGGHVRLEVGSRMASAPDNGWASGGATPAAMRVNDDDADTRAKAREHMRVRDRDQAKSSDAYR
ncbi:hypothetical protein [Methylocapsa acidiphila]|uniref:hypothetical protein n=1 Tax=Methylocapsa acidiphila TaxID=133552 RepID=UPI000408899D|nr:hypothetical protein [Methylocapsa acidiphila]